jgi:hypothetical protein
VYRRRLVEEGSTGSTPPRSKGRGEAEAGGDVDTAVVVAASVVVVAAAVTTVGMASDVHTSRGASTAGVSELRWDAAAAAAEAEVEGTGGRGTDMAEEGSTNARR